MNLKKDKTCPLNVYLLEEEDKGYSVRLQIGQEFLTPTDLFSRPDEAITIASDLLLETVNDEELDKYSQPAYKSIRVQDKSMWDKRMRNIINSKPYSFEQEEEREPCQYELISPHVDRVKKNDVIDIRNSNITLPLLKARKKNGYIGVDIKDLPHYIPAGFNSALDVIEHNFSIVRIRRKQEDKKSWKQLWTRKSL